MKRIILFGAPGSGKGTQAEKIEEEFGYLKISTGDMIREEVNTGSDIGRKIREIMEKGDLISDTIIIDMVRKRIEGNNIPAGYIMDGFPRTLKQAEELSKLKADSELTIFLRVNDEMVAKRITSRRFCKNCGKVYNLLSNPPDEENTCNACGQELFRREDDTEEIIKNRIVVYRKETMPVIEFYKKKGSLKEINAFGSINDIYKEIKELVV